MLTSIINQVAKAVSNVVVVSSIIVDETVVKYNDVKVQVISEVEKAQKELKEQKYNTLQKYYAMYPELFEGADTDEEISKAVFAAKKQEYKEGRKEVKAEVRKEESIKDMLARIKRANG